MECHARQRSLTPDSGHATPLSSTRHSQVHATPLSSTHGMPTHASVKYTCRATDTNTCHATDTCTRTGAEEEGFQSVDGPRSRLGAVGGRACGRGRGPRLGRCCGMGHVQQVGLGLQTPLGPRVPLQCPPRPLRYCVISVCVCVCVFVCVCVCLCVCVCVCACACETQAPAYRKKKHGRSL